MADMGDFATGPEAAPAAIAMTLSCVPATPTSRVLSSLTRRLDKAERELGVQFTRIAQLQASLDILLATLGRTKSVRRSDHPTNERSE
jgi:hypothetical protein